MVAAIGSAVEIGIKCVIESHAEVVAVERAITIAVEVEELTAAETRFKLVGIERTVVVAIGRAVEIGIQIGDFATTHAERDLLWVLRAFVNAIGGAVKVAVEIDELTAALTDNHLFRVVRTFITGVDDAVSVGVGITPVIDAVLITVPGIALDDELDTPGFDESGIEDLDVLDHQGPGTAAIATGKGRIHFLETLIGELRTKFLSIDVEWCRGAEAAVTIVPEPVRAVVMPAHSAEVREQHPHLLTL